MIFLFHQAAHEDQPAGFLQNLRDDIQRPVQLARADELGGEIERYRMHHVRAQHHRNRGEHGGVNEGENGAAMNTVVHVGVVVTRHQTQAGG